MTEHQVRNFIDGKFVAALGGESFENINPATGKLIGHCPRSQLEDADAAVLAAQKAYPSWSRLGFAKRAAILDKAAAIIESRLEEFARAESIDTGKPLSVSMSVDIPRAASNLRFFASAVKHDQTGCHPMDDAINYTVRSPVGVFALVTPWNLPLYLLTWKAAPALVMGNTLVVKPSEMTPTTATLLAEVLTEAGLPAGVFNLVHGFGAEIGGPLISHPGVRGVSFTGGTATGRVVGQAAIADFKKLSLELGGKNATIVFADADLNETLNGITRASFLNQGQICLCGSRVFVERSVFETYRDGLVERAQAMRIGDPLDKETQLGALISHAHRDKVASYAKLAVEEGGEVLTGGKAPQFNTDLDEGAWFQPTVVTGLSITSRCATEEVFGPFVTLHPFDDVSEVIEAANSVEYGLAASVWTKDLKKAHRVSAALECGMVWVNTWLHRDMRVPFGGVKASGLGHEGGEYSLDFYSEAKNICIYTGSQDSDW